MRRVLIKIVCLELILMFVFCISALARESTGAADFLFETGKEYYEQGNYKDALHELEKALMVNPQHAQALLYIRMIEKELGPGELEEQWQEAQDLESAARESAVTWALRQAEAGVVYEEEYEEEEEFPPVSELIAAEADVGAGPAPAHIEEASRELDRIEKIFCAPFERFDNLVEETNEKIAPVKISGEYRMAAGASSDKVTAKFADSDLAERNWRYMDAGQGRFNCFDPVIYNRFRMDLETETEGPFDAYASLVVDPWSFRGTSRTVDITGTGTGGIAEVQLKYFSSNRRALNETYRTTTGDSLGIPEMKVVDDWTTGITKATEWSNNFPIPALEIDREFMPIRKLWFDIGEIDEEFEEGIHLRVFPWASQDQALTTDDPLMLSNRHNYWEVSPWLWEWEQYQVFSETDAFKPGAWSDTLPYRARDSEGYYLTYLRGASLEARGDKFSLQATVAPPLSPWDDYQIVNNIPAAARLKFFPWEEIMLGSTYTFRTGYTGGKEDVFSNTVAVDTEIKINPQATFRAEAAMSRSNTDQTSEVNRWRNCNKDTGQAYRAEVLYESEAGGESFDSLQLKAAGTYMGKDFDTPLSNYTQTRDDMFWGKHISFAEPMEAYEPFRIGDGIDADRYLGELDLRSKLLEEDLELLLNLRRVHRASNDKYIETVVRGEGAYKVSPKLSAKLLVVNRDLPDTVANYDPLIVKSNGDPYLNYKIEDGKDPSTLTGGLGLKYDFTEEISLTGIYERSNDLPDFPRALLNDIAYIGTRTEGGIVYDDLGNQLYGQDFFPLPPYDYFDIYKCKLGWQATEDLALRLNYTRNTFKYAGPIDDNVNHVGFETDYSLSEDWAFSFRYAYSKFIDVYRQNLGEGIHYDGHHNFYTEARYDIAEDTRLRLQYGTHGYFNPAAGEYSTGWSLATVDTEHLFRIFIDGKF